MLTKFALLDCDSRPSIVLLFVAFTRRGLSLLRFLFSLFFLVLHQRLKCRMRHLCFNLKCKGKINWKFAWHRLTDRSIDRLIDWMIHLWLAWLIDWLIEWSIDYLLDWSIDWLIEWFRFNFEPLTSQSTVRCLYWNLEAVLHTRVIYTMGLDSFKNKNYSDFSIKQWRTKRTR